MSRLLYINDTIYVVDDVATMIIKLLRRHPQGLSFTDIVRMTRKPKETVNRRLKMLLQDGIIEKKRQGVRVIYTHKGDLG